MKIVVKMYFSSQSPPSDSPRGCHYDAVEQLSQDQFTKCFESRLEQIYRLCHHSAKTVKITSNFFKESCFPRFVYDIFGSCVTCTICYEEVQERDTIRCILCKQCSCYDCYISQCIVKRSSNCVFCGLGKIEPLSLVLKQDIFSINDGDMPYQFQRDNPFPVNKSLCLDMIETSPDSSCIWLLHYLIQLIKLRDSKTPTDIFSSIPTLLIERDLLIFRTMIEEIDVYLAKIFQIVRLFTKIAPRDTYFFCPQKTKTRSEQLVPSSVTLEEIQNYLTLLMEDESIVDQIPETLFGTDTKATCSVTKEIVDRLLCADTDVFLIIEQNLQTVGEPSVLTLLRNTLLNGIDALFAFTPGAVGFDMYELFHQLSLTAKTTNVGGMFVSVWCPDALFNVSALVPNNHELMIGIFDPEHDGFVGKYESCFSSYLIHFQEILYSRKKIIKLVKEIHYITMSPSYLFDVYFHSSLFLYYDTKESGPTTSNIHRCPTCGVFQEKASGCDHMICTVCGAQFDWITKRDTGYVANPYLTSRLPNNVEISDVILRWSRADSLDDNKIPLQLFEGQFFDDAFVVEGDAIPMALPLFGSSMIDPHITQQIWICFTPLISALHKRLTSYREFINTEITWCRDHLYDIMLESTLKGHSFHYVNKENLTLTASTVDMIQKVSVYDMIMQTGLDVNTYLFYDMIRFCRFLCNQPLASPNMILTAIDKRLNAPSHMAAWEIQSAIIDIINNSCIV